MLKSSLYSPAGGYMCYYSLRILGFKLIIITVKIFIRRILFFALLFGVRKLDACKNTSNTVMYPNNYLRRTSLNAVFQCDWYRCWCSLSVGSIHWHPPNWLWRMSALSGISSCIGQATSPNRRRSAETAARLCLPKYSIRKIKIILQSLLKAVMRVTPSKQDNS